MIENSIIGHTGFVGSTLMRLCPGASGFNSRSISLAEEQNFGTLYCAAAPGSMLQANRDPQGDASCINTLIASLQTMRADRFILISSIAVLDRFDAGHDEKTSSYQTETPYGMNRRRLEEACQDHFPRALIVRLPALFGQGLKKNLVFDLANPMPTMLNVSSYDTLRAGLAPRLGKVLQDIYGKEPSSGMYSLNRDTLEDHPDRDAFQHAVQSLGVDSVMFHNIETTYQFYEMAHLVEDVDRAWGAGLGVLHLAPEPLRVSDVHLALRGYAMAETPARLHLEDMRTRHSDLWGLDGPYIRDRESVLSSLKRFYINREAV